MSRRGRGGGRGRGGRFGGSQKIGGVELSWDPDLDLDKPQPTPTFPVYKPAQPQPLTSQEKKQVAHFLTLRKCFHEGPYYTVLGANVRIGKASNKPAAVFDPFDGMPRYSQKYVKKPRKLPDLDSQSFELKYFPKELHPTLDPSIRLTNGDDGAGYGTKPKRSSAARINGADATENRTAVEGEEEEAPPREGNADDDDPLGGEDVDDDFDEEDDEGGDYNAEGYFDDGGDDAGEDADGGDGDGGDYY
ncbi:MAG: hypothetical protein HETSPECPRED_009603 [Heterodermia speciosa]|uniref:DNA-directed RNA polymerase III subunit n=1 Tax=Heterodermia speciosa TaxID=116794 RepID=A0A8H3IDY0_9LECA|nr:MAG: hypothetical protein HETSPECPRED_009603 [Heterodermia speciosa]